MENVKPKILNETRNEKEEWIIMFDVISVNSVSLYFDYLFQRFTRGLGQIGNSPQAYFHFANS